MEVVSRLLRYQLRVSASGHFDFVAKIESSSGQEQSGSVHAELGPEYPPPVHCCGLLRIGLSGICWLWWSWKKNLIWLLDRL